jgi:hypothetical protein
MAQNGRTDRAVGLGQNQSQNQSQNQFLYHRGTQSTQKIGSAKIAECLTLVFLATYAWVS